MKEFFNDYARILTITSEGPVKSLAYKRLRMCHQNFKLHRLLNQDREEEAIQDDPRDFSNIVKVDTHIHLAAAMTAKHLLLFIKNKAKTEGDRIVMKSKEGTPMTLRQVFQKLDLNPEQLNLDGLDVHADEAFQRFDIFNTKYNPFGKSELREIFLKSDNYMGGEYFAEITKQLLVKLEESQYLAAEYRISIYGRSAAEWDSLAGWVTKHNLKSPNQRWIIQVPRLFVVYQRAKALSNYQEMLENIFRPLFECTIDPQSHPLLSQLMVDVSGFDSVDDESRPEVDFSQHVSSTKPQDWTHDNPPYAYYMYYMWANITALNKLRKSKGLNQFSFRPHSGESGPVEHLAASFLAADSINHGIKLQESPVLQYLYYLKQVGLAVSPLSNNKLFVNFNLNPFKKFFYRGLNVSLSTDDPLQFHFTETPLIEEYAIAAQKWGFSVNDLSEIASNSVRQSGFEDDTKKKWLGPNYKAGGIAGNDIAYTNVPNIRVAFRTRCLQEELKLLQHWANLKKSDASNVDPLVRDPTKLVDYCRLRIKNQETEVSFHILSSVELLQKSMDLRKKWISVCSSDPLPTDTEFKIKLINGVYQVFESVTINGKEFVATTPLIKMRSFTEYQNDLMDLRAILKNQEIHAYSSKRLKILDCLWEFHLHLNGKRERDLVKGGPKDYFHVYKCDNRSKLNNCMSSKTLLDFIKLKLKDEPDEIVVEHKDSQISLLQAFNKLGIPPNNFTLDSLDRKRASSEDDSLYSDLATDPGNFKSSPLYETFLEHDNLIEGKYFAELVKIVLGTNQKSENDLFEYSVSIFGRAKDEWDKLARFIVNNNLLSDQVRYTVDLVMSYSTLKANYHIKNFQQVLDNIFEPLFDVAVKPSSHPELHIFLQHVSGFSTEKKQKNFSKNEKNIDIRHMRESKMYYSPNDWDLDVAPPVNYYSYYFWSNIQSLNSLRKAQGQAPFKWSPCMNTGDLYLTSSCYLLAENVYDAISISSNHTVQYLFYLSQIGISMHPLLANAVSSVHYSDHPFDTLFRRGLKVSLATGKPLQLHIGTDPLAEEYALAAQMWKLSTGDLCEIARNSVLLSGFSAEKKRQFVGEHYHFEGVKGNDATKTNVPNIRVDFRQSTLEAEQDTLTMYLKYGQ
eukprot:TRINITY_DN13409_c0_g1_i1.p1 TRINITY_DN13409_c0_g1~~TRINITY_DN13409_c0_g1_i1.p1  ORF type:complete len:1291 (-),score=286.12 TRINITY_DN13409_c0_g1_i1:18-3410(-)